MIHVKDEEESQYARDSLSPLTLISHHVNEILDQAQFRLSWSKSLFLAITQTEDSSHQFRHSSDEIHRVTACVASGFRSTQSHYPD